MQRKHWPIGVALVVIVVALGAHLVWPTPAPPEPSSTRARNTAGGGEAEVSPEDTDPEPRVRAPSVPGDEAPSAPPEGEPAAAVEGCDHPLIVAGRAETRTYRWSQSDEERSAEMRLRPRGTRALPSGERLVRWAVRVNAEDDDSELGEAELTTRCTPGLDAEEPWFGILERSLGLTLTEDAGRWRWPAELAPGQRFEGTATFDPTGSDMRAPEGTVGPQVLRVTRRHVVVGRERVTVPAGRFEAWRVTYEEQHAFGDRGETGTGTLWVAPEVGLVKTVAENSRGVVSTIELMR